jgi:hypothetical protein
VKVILEGLTGAGKTHTIAAMRELGLAPATVVPEEETFGELMDELDGPVDPAHLVRRLTAVCARLGDDFLLERFHLSYYALVPDWSHYAAIDAHLATLGVSLVLLGVGDLRGRSLLRAEHGHTDWQHFAERYGSEENALAALDASQARRFEALRLTALRHLVIDTEARAWHDYARTIAAWATGTPAGVRIER